MGRNLLSGADNLGVEPIWPLRWSQKQRLEFIEFRLQWEGRVNRSDLMHCFGISMPQASLDLAKYRELAPENAVYDSTEKTYLTGNSFRPMLVNGSSDGFLNRVRAEEFSHSEVNSTLLGWRPPVAVVHAPNRSIDAKTLRTVLRAIRERRSVEITYQSMQSAVPAVRRIAPHALAFDGLRWHTRAFCHQHFDYRDFVLARVLGIASEDVFEANPEADLAWNTHTDVVIMPAAWLSDSQRRATEMDYGMREGRFVHRVREALLFYHLRHLGLLDPPEATSSKEQIMLVNRLELEPMLKRHKTESH